MSTSTATSFLDALRNSELMDEQKLNELLLYFPGDADNSKEVAAYLVKQKVLTDFQAKFLLAGRFRGLSIGPYSILNKIGSGGMGIVYLAEHRKLSRKVAIKIFPEDRLSDQLAVERFYREARSAAKLDHPNIVKAHDVNEHQGTHYLVMDYIHGTNLQKYLEKKGPLPWKSVLNIIIQVCRGLQHAYERNFIHRDIKPANLLIDKTGHVKILDLGLARSLELKQDNLTADLSDGKDVQGSIDYVSPEQAFGRTAVDIRSDIYSLGATAYTLMTGEPIVKGSPAQKLLQHQMNLPTPLNQINSDIPKAFAYVIQKMLAKQPAQRYSTPTAVVSALKQFFPPSATSSAMVMATIIDADPITEVSPTSSVATRTTSVISSSDEPTKKVKKSSGKKFKKKKPSSWNVMQIAIIASVLLLASGLGWASFALLGKSGKIDSSELARTIPQAGIDPVLGSGSNNSIKGNSQPSNPTPPPTRTPPAQAPATQAGSNRSNNQTNITEGQRLPDIIGEDLENTNFRLSDYEGKVVLLDFWGFWCPHCVKMIPHEKVMVTQYRNRPFSILGVNNDKDQQTINQGMQQYQVNWRSFKDKLPNGTQISKIFGIKGFPTLLLLDHRGVVKKVWVGAPDTKELDKMVEDLVKVAERTSKSS